MSKKTVVLMLALSMALTAACKSEIDNKPAAEVSEPAAVEKDEAVANVGQALTQVAFEKDGSSIEWVGANVTVDHDGGFREWSGTASLNEKGQLVAVNFEVDTTSVYSDDERLTRELKKEHFFYVDAHPKSTFVSTEIKENAVDGATHSMKGILELRGVKKEIQFPATVSVTDGKLEASSEFTLKRSDFNITYKGQADDIIKDNVLMKLKFQADVSKAGTVAAE